MISPDFKNLEMEIDEGIALLYLNRPHKNNAITPGMFDELNGASSFFQGCTEADVLIISGRG
ncbi:MAG: enoyl-CoA hydratase, partial [Actinobacteria bacterium]|nr:enoyl-CoA hydratase [Actinomycetota bacterium]